MGEYTVTSPTESETPSNPFEPGARCLLIIMKQRFLVAIQKVDDDTIEVSFPVRDFPVEGMRVEMEFHDLEGYTRFESEVLRAPKEAGDFLVLKRPPAYVRNYHRGSWRVPVDFKAEVKGHVHPRRLHVPVVNLSTGGILILTDSDMAIGDMLEASLPVPALDGEKLTCKVVHRADEIESSGLTQIGCTFVSPDPASIKVLSEYIWDRIRELGPAFLPMEA